MNAPKPAEADIDPSSYTHWRGTALGAITETIEHDLILSMISPLAGKKVLDVGCGDGALMEKLVHLGAEGVGIDADPGMIAAAKARYGATYQIADATALPFADGSFDRVVAMTVLCVCAEPDKMVKEMARVLRPGGRLVIGELGRWSLWALMRRVRALFGDPLWRRARFFTQAQLAALAADAGLAAQAFHGAVYYPPIGVAARLFSGMDAALSHAFGTLGAAFIALSADKNAQANE